MHMLANVSSYQQPFFFLLEKFHQKMNWKLKINKNKMILEIFNDQKQGKK
jgi:hypothetical protein